MRRKMVLAVVLFGGLIQRVSACTDEINQAVRDRRFADVVQMLAPPLAQEQECAQTLMGQLYIAGNGVDRDYGKGFDLSMKGAEKGNAEAQNSVGQLLHDGMGVSKDVNEAARWFQKAAAQDNARAQYNLGRLYQSGTGVGQDPRKAFELFLESAGNGHGRSPVYRCGAVLHGHRCQAG